jgi:hypothetical protein
MDLVFFFAGWRPNEGMFTTTRLLHFVNLSVFFPLALLLLFVPGNFFASAGATPSGFFLAPSPPWSNGRHRQHMSPSPRKGARALGGLLSGDTSGEAGCQGLREKLHSCGMRRQTPVFSSLSRQHPHRHGVRAAVLLNTGSFLAANLTLTISLSLSLSGISSPLPRILHPTPIHRLRPRFAGALPTSRRMLATSLPHLLLPL